MNNKGYGKQVSQWPWESRLQECIDKFFRVRHQMNLLHCPRSEFPKESDWSSLCHVTTPVEQTTESLIINLPESEEMEKG